MWEHGHEELETSDSHLLDPSLLCSGGFDPTIFSRAQPVRKTHPTQAIEDKGLQQSAAFFWPESVQAGREGCSEKARSPAAGQPGRGHRATPTLPPLCKAMALRPPSQPCPPALYTSPPPRDEQSWGSASGYPSQTASNPAACSTPAGRGAVRPRLWYAAILTVRRSRSCSMAAVSHGATTPLQLLGKEQDGWGAALPRSLLQVPSAS